MQKLRSKLGLLVVLSCLTLAIGLVASTGSASAHGEGHNHGFKTSPRISMRVLSSRFKFHGRYVQRAVIYGIGFNTCNSCTNASSYDNCTGSCNSNCNTSCGDPSCSYYYYNANTCGSSSSGCSSGCGSSSSNGCANYSACGNSSSNGCANHSACGSSSSNGCANYSACGSSSSNGCANHSACGNSSSNGCANYSACGNSSSNGCANHSACGSVSGTVSGSNCSCANVQSSIPIYGQTVNLSQVPVNAFGEFQIIVLVQAVPHPTKVQYRLWAVNRYNNDCSNILTEAQY